MKKIISIVCVLAMMFSFAVTANAAADNEIFIAVESQTDDELIISINSNSTTTIATISAYVDLTDALAKGAVYTSVEDINGNATPKYVANQKLFQIQYAPTSGARLTGANKLATLTLDISAVTEDFTIGRKANSGTRIVFKIFGVDGDGVLYDATSEFTWDSTLNITKASAFVPETVKGAVVEGEDDIVLEKDPANANFKNTYLGTAVFAATLGADVNYSEAGLIWVKDDVETANKFTVDASVIAGGGTFEYAVAMYGIPANVDIDAIPYYVTAE